MSLKNKHFAIFVADLYEDMEFWYPYFRMQEEEVEMTVIGPEADYYSGKKGMPAKADIAIDNAKVDDYDALIIPGGYSPDVMRRNPQMVEFVKNIYDKGKPVAAICHGPWMLASADIIEGKNVTSFYSIKDDVKNAGGNWKDQEVVVDKNIITSRNPHDLPAFCKAIIRMSERG